MIKPEPTRRAVIDVGRHCNCQCHFCYYSHLGDLLKQSYEEKETLKAQIDNAAARGNNYLDFTGGEPTICPHIAELIEYAENKYGMKSCIITNALCGENTIYKLLNTCVDDFLVSIHGTKFVHDYLVNVKGAREKQERFLKIVCNEIPIRFNLVINRYNQHELADVAKWATQWNVKIFNFINFNPHHEWQADRAGTKKIIANLRVVESELHKAIAILEKNGIGVNVRYYPMCRIASEYRRCICNDYHVSFDPYEWDYNIFPKTFETHLKWAIAGSNGIEHKEFPCMICDLQYICGGINKHYYSATDGMMINAVRENIEDKYDFYQYRKDNVMTLKERV